MDKAPESKLIDAVTEALLHDEVTADSRIEVVAEGQQVWLHGEVDSQAIKDEAELIAKRTGDVALVVSELRVRREDGRGPDDRDPDDKTVPGTTFPLTTH